MLESNIFLVCVQLKELFFVVWLKVATSTERTLCVLFESICFEKTLTAAVASVEINTYRFWSVCTLDLYVVCVHFSSSFFSTSLFIFWHRIQSARRFSLLPSVRPLQRRPIKTVYAQYKIKQIFVYSFNVDKQKKKITKTANIFLFALSINQRKHIFLLHFREKR